jgi:stage II sporulation protein AA (anti-sigma F factor antagonist)
MLESKLIGSTLYVGLDGELDESSAVYVRSKFDEIIGKTNMKKVVVELSQLKFMDSTGIGVLIGRYKKLLSLGIPVYLANPTQNIDKLLKLSGLYGIMPKVDFKEA